MLFTCFARGDFDIRGNFLLRNKCIVTIPTHVEQNGLRQWTDSFPTFFYVKSSNDLSPRDDHAEKL